MRLDKWLWCARFFKTRGLAVEEIGKGRVMVNGQLAKAAREVRAGDLLSIRQGTALREVRIEALSNYRGPAPVAQQLYAETPASQARREELAKQRQLAPEPADELRHGRPTKRDRRQIDQLRQQPTLDARWSAIHGGGD
ncbi:RNA-binding S4 domain-containing protein [Corticibacter populi]|nr:RNA-binding S4 domain-containing protein [Corticibacter populi]